jgi:hypothetical protein
MSAEPELKSTLILAWHIAQRRDIWQLSGLAHQTHLTSIQDIHMLLGASSRPRGCVLGPVRWHDVLRSKTDAIPGDRAACASACAPRRMQLMSRLRSALQAKQRIETNEKEEIEKSGHAVARNQACRAKTFCRQRVREGLPLVCAGLSSFAPLDRSS